MRNKKNSAINALYFICLLFVLSACHQSSTQIEDITPPVEMPDHLTVRVLTPSGTSIHQAEVMIGDQIVQTDQKGQAQFKVPTVVDNIHPLGMVRVKRDGFIDQYLHVQPNALLQMQVSLLPVKTHFNIPAIEKAQVIENDALQARVILPAHALLRPDGDVATGAAKVEFTPWDLKKDDLYAMLGNGVAKNTQQQMLDLISLGIISIRFKNNQGEVLQLASDKVAELRIDLPVKEVNNQALKVGQKIPLWFFDEVNHVWSERGEGQVISSLTGEHKLALSAQISQVSSWAWALPFQDNHSIRVQCFANNQPITCNVNAHITRPDGLSVARHAFVDVAGSTLFKLPSAGEIQWQASDLNDAHIADFSSVVSDVIRIDLKPVVSHKFTQCVRDDAPIACTIQWGDKLYQVSAGGSYIKSLTPAQFETGDVKSTYLDGLKLSLFDRLQHVSDTIDHLKIELSSFASSGYPAVHPYVLLCESAQLLLYPVCKTTFDIENWFESEISEFDVTRHYYDLKVNEAVTVYFPTYSGSGGEIQTVTRANAKVRPLDGSEKTVYWYQDGPFTPRQTILFNLDESECWDEEC